MAKNPWKIDGYANGPQVMCPRPKDKYCGY